MDTISIPLNPSTEDIESLRTLFNKHSVENKGVLSREELNLLVISLANKPPAYEIMEVLLYIFSFTEATQDMTRLELM